MHEEDARSTPKSSQKAFLPMLVGAILLLTALAWWRESSDSGSGGDGTPFLAQVKPGQRAPAFQGVSLAGNKIAFPDSFRGKLVLLDFWATWCGPCQAEFPHLREAYEKLHPRGLEILGISLDASRGVSPDAVRRFLKQHDASWEVLYADADKTADAYRVTAIPAPFLVDGDTGLIVAVGDRLRGAALTQTVTSALEKKSR